MKKTLKNKLLAASAASFIGMISGVENAHAAGGGNQDFNTIVGNISDSISNVPGLITGVSYMMGIMLGVLGVLKIKDHVENPGQNPLQQGAIRLAAGGALFALPIVYEAMQTTIGTGAGVDVPTVKAINMKVDG